MKCCQENLCDPFEGDAATTAPVPAGPASAVSVFGCQFKRHFGGFCPEYVRMIQVKRAHFLIQEVAKTPYEPFESG